MKEYYTYFCICFHEVAAQLDNFPLIDLQDVPHVLNKIGIHIDEKSNKVGNLAIKKYLEVTEQEDKEQVLLNRAKFAEVLLLTIEAAREVEKN